MELIRKFLTFLAVQNYSDHTIRNYEFILKLFFQSISKKLTEVVLDDIINYLGSLKFKHYANNTIKLRIIALKSFYKYLYNNNLYDRKLDIPLPRFEKKTIKILTVEEIKRIINKIELKAIQDFRDRAIIELLYTSGLRISEFVKLSAEDFQWIKLKKASKKQHLRIHIQGKGKRERNLYVNEITGNVVMSYLAMRQDGTKFLFVSHHGADTPGKPISKESIRKILKKRAKAARVTKRVYPHIFRHSIATHLLEAGVNIRIIKDFLGHSCIKSTEQYLDLLEFSYRKAAEEIIPKLLYAR